jgi:hypothetical protein
MRRAKIHAPGLTSQVTACGLRQTHLLVHAIDTTRHSVTCKTCHKRYVEKENRTSPLPQGTVPTEAFFAAMRTELAAAERAHPPLHSLHEAYGVLQEEFEEFWAEVKQKRPSAIRIHAELVQLATMAWRTCRDLGYEDEVTP